MSEPTPHEPTPHEILHPRHWKAAKGYAAGVAASGRMVFTGGIVGWNADQVFEAQDFAGQAAQALRAIVEVLHEAGASPGHLTRLTWYVTDKHAYLGALREVGAAYREIIGRHYPAMALVQVVALVEDAALVEIEATAVIPVVPPAMGGVRAALAHEDAANTDAANTDAPGLAPRPDAEIAVSAKGA